MFICPVSRNINDAGNKSNPYYLAYDAKIIECMTAANEGLTNPTPIINFKPVSDVLPGFDTVRVMLFHSIKTLDPVSNAANAQ